MTKQKQHCTSVGTADLAVTKKNEAQMLKRHGSHHLASECNLCQLWVCCCSGPFTAWSLGRRQLSSWVQAHLEAALHFALGPRRVNDAQTVWDQPGCFVDSAAGPKRESAAAASWLLAQAKLSYASSYSFEITLAAKEANRILGDHVT